MQTARALLWILVVAITLGAADSATRLVSHAPPGTAAASARLGGLPFIADDYARGLAQARARKLPIFIESWAPW